MLKKLLAESIASLPTRFGQRLGTLFEELLKDDNRCLTCNIVTAQDEIHNATTLAFVLANQEKVDALFTTKQGRLSLPRESPQVSSYRLDAYHATPFEEARRRYAEDIESLDLLTEAQVRDIIVRTSAYAQKLRLYDKQIGKGNGVERFKAGIEFVIDAFLSSRYTSAEKRSVEIFTCEDAPNPPQYRDGFDRLKAGRNDALRTTVTSALHKPLQARFPDLEINVLFKHDHERIFHARHLEAGSSVLIFDRGFDLFDPTGGFVRNIVKIDNPRRAHLRECRLLPDARFS